jgi:hypothetical protein
MQSDGVAYLDVNDDFGLRLNKYLEQLTVLNKITQSSAITTPVPRSRKNLILLERFELNNLNQDPDPLRIEVIKDGERIPFDLLRVVDVRDTEYEIEIFGGGWVDELKDTRLRDISIGTFSYILPNVLSTWADTDAIAYPALCHYGAFNQSGSATRKDLRFWFNIFKVLQKAFAANGWTFKSPYLEGPVGSRLYAYLSGERWHHYRDKNDEARVDLNIAAPKAQTGIVNQVLFDEVSDPLDLYNNVSAPNQYLYPLTGQNPSYLDIEISDLVVTLPAPSGGNPRGQFLLAVSKNNIFDTIYLELFDGDPDEEVTKTITRTITDDNATPLDKYAVWMGYQDFDSDTPTAIPFTIESGDLVFSPDPSRYIEDDLITLEDLVDENITGFDLLAGVTHFIDGKFETNYPAREVTLYPPFDVDQLDEIVEGFILSNATPVDLTNKVVTGSRRVSVKENKQARYVELSFKNTTDSFIKSNKLNSQPYSRTVDLGKGEIKTEKLANKFFEPTMEVKTTAAELGPGKETPYLPALWDNTDGNLSNKIAPRIGFCYGLIEQYEDDGVTPYELVFEGSDRDDFGYISQVPTRATEFGDPVHIAYGNFGKDAYNLFYKKSLATKFPAFSIEFLLWINYQEYLNYTFRRPYIIHYNDAYLYYQLVGIKDFKLDGVSSTPAEFIILE